MEYLNNSKGYRNADLLQLLNAEYFYIIYNTCITKRDHEGYCSDAENISEEEEVPSEFLATKIESVDPIHSVIMMFIRNKSLNEFLSFYINDVKKYVEDLPCDSGYCIPSRGKGSRHEREIKWIGGCAIAPSDTSYQLVNTKFLYYDWVVCTKIKPHIRRLQIAKPFMPWVLAILQFKPRIGRDCTEIILMLYLNWLQDTLERPFY